MNYYEQFCSYHLWTCELQHNCKNLLLSLQIPSTLFFFWYFANTNQKANGFGSWTRSMLKALCAILKCERNPKCVFCMLAFYCWQEINTFPSWSLRVFLFFIDQNQMWMPTINKSEVNIWSMGSRIKGIGEESDFGATTPSLNDEAAS